MPPLAIDLQVEAVDPPFPSGHGSARLAIDLDAGPALRDLSVRLILPSGMEAIDDPLPHAPFELGAGARRSWKTTVFARQPGTFPLQVEATYRIGDGETVRTRQAVVLRDGGAPEGRHHAGAWEVPALAIEDVPR
jgi:hypothetical protein